MVVGCDHLPALLAVVLVAAQVQDLARGRVPERVRSYGVWDACLGHASSQCLADADGLELPR